MVVYHLDSSIVAAWARGRNPGLIDRFAKIDPTCLAISFVVEGELRVGVLKGPIYAAAKRATQFFEGIRIVHSSPEIVRRYAETRARLEQAGRRMDDNDLWIAASALAEGATLVTADEAFARVPSLKTENWRV